MEAAASLATLITLTLQSAKFVYQSIDGIRDGPSIITNSTNSIKQLEGLLRQIFELIRRSEQHRQYHDATSWNLLKEKVSHCSNSMEEASSKLKTLSPSDAKNRMDKVWKRIKVSLKESYFTRLDALIRGHVAEIELQLQIINRDACQSQNNDASQASLHHIETQIDIQATAVRNDSFQKAQEVKSSLHDMALLLETANKDRVEKSRQMNECFQSTTELIFGRLNENKDYLQQQTQSIGNQITAKIDKVQDISAGQSETIVELLRQIHDCLKTKSDSASSADCNSRFKPGGAEDEICSERGRFSAAIDRLCLLASNQATTYFSDEAEGIIDDLEHVLNALIDYDATESSQSLKSRKRRHSAVDEATSVSREIKKIRGIVTASCGVEISESSSATTKFGIKQRTISTKRSVKEYDLANCRVVVSIKSSSHDSSMRTTANQKEPIGSILEAVQGNFSLLARNSIKPTRISASFERRITSLGFNCPHPRLSFHPIVPENAEIFTAVAQGDMDWMLELLNTGKASLRDCDPEGRSLLNYAIHYCNLASCRYLIDRGADVNCLEIRIDGDHLCPPLDQTSFDDFDLDHDELYMNLAIKQCLLEADADPLVPTRDMLDSTILEAFLATSHVDVLAMILRHSKEFIDLKSRDGNGRDYFLRMLVEFYFMRDSTGRCRNDLSQNIRLLVSHGADIGMRDRYGTSCLHALISNSLKYNQAMIDPLCLLIQLGADIHAVTNSGYSVTEWAHFLRRGHAWEEALEKAGYDAERVYLEDFNLGWSISDDAFAPGRDRPRRRGSFSSQYYNVGYFDIERRKRPVHLGDYASDDELDEFEDGTFSEVEEDELIDGEGEEQDNFSDLEEYEHGPFHGFVDEHPRESDSDEEMGGVPISG